jgi:2-keto-3-deoxygluconate permease
MRIMKTINKIPGGLMVVPLFIGMIVNTFFPNLLKIGGFTEALGSAGYPTVLGMYLFTVGTQMTLSAASASWPSRSPRPPRSRWRWRISSAAASSA